MLALGGIHFESQADRTCDEVHVGRGVRREDTRIVPRFLAWAVEWMEVPLTETGKGGRGAGKAWVGKQEPHFGLVQFKSLLDIQVTLSRRQMDLWVSSSAERSALES